MRRLFLLGGLSALVVAGFPPAGAQTPTVTSVTGSADGLFADLAIEPGGLNLSVGPEPSVTLPPEGGTVDDELLSISETVGPVDLASGTLTVAAEGELGPAGFATADAVVEDLFLGLDLTEDLSILDAEVISASCEADLEGVTGSSNLVEVSVLGSAPLAVNPAPNTVQIVTVPNVGSVTLTLNRQLENPDGSLTVTALAVDVDIDIVETVEVEGTLEVSTATCGVVEGEIPPDEVPEEVVVPAAPSAPVPVPVPAAPRFTG